MNVETLVLVMFTTRDMREHETRPVAPTPYRDGDNIVRAHGRANHSLIPLLFVVRGHGGYS